MDSNESLVTLVQGASLFAHSDFSFTHLLTLPYPLSFYSQTTASPLSTPPPSEERVAEIIEKLPSHPSLITKTGTAILGSGVLATAISQELYVFDDKTVIAVGYMILFAYVAKQPRCVRKDAD
jgi:hypothetical protein